MAPKLKNYLANTLRVEREAARIERRKLRKKERKLMHKLKDLQLGMDERTSELTMMAHVLKDSQNSCL